MIVEEKAAIIKRIIEKLNLAGIDTSGQFIVTDKILTSPDVARVIFGDDLIINHNTPAWRYHQHQLLNFIQSRNEDEMLHYIVAYL